MKNSSQNQNIEDDQIRNWFPIYKIEIIKILMIWYVFCSFGILESKWKDWKNFKFGIRRGGMSYDQKQGL